MTLSKSQIRSDEASCLKFSIYKLSKETENLNVQYKRHLITRNSISEDLISQDVYHKPSKDLIARNSISEDLISQDAYHKPSEDLISQDAYHKPSEDLISQDAYHKPSEDLTGPRINVNRNALAMKRTEFLPVKIIA